MTLCDRDRELLDTWATPDDPSTHDKRDRLILALWAENRRLDELLALEEARQWGPQRGGGSTTPLPRGRPPTRPGGVPGRGSRRPRGNCGGLCGAVDSRHRELDAIVSRIAAGDTARDLADDYDLPVRFIGRVARDLAHKAAA